MEEKEYMVRIVDQLNQLTSQMENAASTAYLAKEGVMYANVESELIAKTLDFFAQVLYDMTDELREVTKLIAEKEKIEI